MGIIENGVHTLPVRVYFEDTDTGGVVYYANYLKYAERARTEMLRCIGFPHSILIKKYGINFVVRHCEADYFASSYYKYKNRQLKEFFLTWHELDNNYSYLNLEKIFYRLIHLLDQSIAQLYDYKLQKQKQV